MNATLAGEALALAETAATPRAAAALLRDRLAPLRVVVVDAFDMRDEAPAATGPTRVLYWGESDGHCWRVTSDASRAAAVFVADRAASP